jgi:hypothetical protein
MVKNKRVLHERFSHDRQSGGNITPRKGRRSSNQKHSKILQDESLPSMRSLRSKSLFVRGRGMGEQRGVFYLIIVLSYRNNLSLMAGNRSVERWWKDTDGGKPKCFEEDLL